MCIAKISWVAVITIFLFSCSSNSNEQNTPGPNADGPSSSDEPNANDAQLVSFVLTSFASGRQNQVRRLPTDETPILYLTAGEGQQFFAPSGKGNFSARCEGYSFDYVYKDDPPSGRNRIELENVLVVPIDDTFGCDPSFNAFAVDAATTSLPVFSQAASLLSDQLDSQLVVYGDNSELLTFQLSDVLLENQNTLALTTTDWILTTYRVGASSLTPAPTDNPVSLRFTTDGMVTGTSPCHTIQGTYEAQESRISFNDVWLSGNNCALEPDTRVNLHGVDQLMNALGSALQGPAYAVYENNRLYLSQNDTVFVFAGRALADNEQRLNFTILASGGYPLPDNFDDPINQPLVQLVQQQDVLNALWNDAVARGNTIGLPPTIDFERSLVMYLRMGFRPHLGESMTLRSASSNDDHVLIEVNTSFSDYDDPVLGLCAYDDAIAHPFSFVLVQDTAILNDTIVTIEHKTSACSGLSEAIEL